MTHNKLKRLVNSFVFRYLLGPLREELTKIHMEELQIRLATTEDIEDIYSVHTEAIRQVYHEKYSQEQIEEWARRQGPDQYKQPINNCSIYIALLASKIVAFGHLEENSKDRMQYEVKALFVHPSYSRCGIGARLYRFLENIAMSQGSKSMVVKSSFNGEAFYNANGFISGETEAHLGCSSNCAIQCIRMVKNL